MSCEPTSSVTAVWSRNRQAVVAPGSGSVILILEQIRIGIGVEHRRDFIGIARRQGKNPALAESIFVDYLGIVGERIVDGQHATGNWRINVARRFNRLDHRTASAGVKLGANLGQLDINQISQLRLGVRRDADSDTAVVFDAQPFVRLEEAKIAWNF